jgi:hypothetical protein
MSLFLIAVLVAGLAPPSSPHVKPRALAVLDDRDRPQELPEGPAPTLLLPLFTRCGGTCPLTALSLKQAIAGAQPPFRVVLLSFDGDDTAEDLRAFREHMDLPAEWLLVRSAGASELRAFLDQLDFHFMKTEGGFDHPNQSFVFSPGGIWAGTFSGAPGSPTELRDAYQRSIDADDAGSLQSLRSWLLRPEALIVLACAGLAAAFAGILLFSRKATEKAPCRSSSSRHS